MPRCRVKIYLQLTAKPVGVIVQADMKGLEPRILADRTDCRALLEIFNDPKQAAYVYQILGRDILKRDIDKKKNPRDYAFAKKGLLATSYNAQPFTLQRQLFVEMQIEATEEECAAFIQGLLIKCPEMKDYIWEQRRRVARDQEIACLTGFIRHLPNGGIDAEGFKHVWNEAVNVEIQHTASMIAKLWSNYVQRGIRECGLGMRDVFARKTVYLGPVHDSVSHDCRTSAIAKRVLDIYSLALSTIQGTPMVALIGRNLRCPLDIETTSGPTWAKE